ncbi:site-specific integrase [Sphingobium sp. H39-3-25]|uniref:tyrosine-type recombinase/integrase n=1 Tax=Sphingobium arseniciresistens TaxID=3030834 RepID=UPI0023B93B72|nr:site-specific integrase [Sphingobium arseniciresistens]
MPVYQREGSPYWWYSFSIDGRRFRGSTGCTTQKQAKIVEAEKFQDAVKHPGKNDQWRLREVLGTYWAEHACNVESASDIFFHFELLSEFLGRDLPVDQLTNALLMDYRGARRGGSIKVTEAMKEGRPTAWNRRMVTAQGFIRAVKPQTVNRDLAHLQAAIGWAADVHGKTVPQLSWKRLKAKEAPHRIRFAAADEFAALMEAAHPAIRPIILCAVTTGLRRGNILMLDWHQVDLAGSTITLPTGKGDKPHLVRIAPVLRAELGRTRPKDRKGPVFDLTNFRKRWQAAVKEAELTDFKFHDIRHTFASWARQNGADLADICDALNHSSVSVTMRYAHVKPTETMTAFDRVADLLQAQSRSQSAKTGS